MEVLLEIEIIQIVQLVLVQMVHQVEEEVHGQLFGDVLLHTEVVQLDKDMMELLVVVEVQTDLHLVIQVVMVSVGLMVLHMLKVVMVLEPLELL